MTRRLTVHDVTLICRALDHAARAADEAADRLKGVGSATEHELRDDARLYRRVRGKFL